MTAANEALQPVLEVDKISKNFGAVSALADVSLDIFPGEVVALVGDNGAGKSTLVKILAGVYSPDSGSIRLNGKKITIQNPHDSIAHGIATVFQDLALCDNLDVVNNLFLGREISRFQLDEIEMELRAWDLLKELSAKIPSVRVPVASLSGGQRQTVAIARSLLGEPNIVLLDEPTAALGVEQTAEVLNLIERLRDKGMAIIVVSHNMDDVFAVADRIAVLRLGSNNGEFLTRKTVRDQIVAAITGSAENALSLRERNVSISK